MKKIILLCVLVCIANSAFAFVEAPTWSEFCPLQYVNAQPVEDTSMGEMKRYIAALSIVGLPWAFYDKAKYELIEENNYWAQRKMQFERDISLCKHIKNDGELVDKYMYIRQNEISKNQQRENMLMMQKQLELQNLTY